MLVLNEKQKNKIIEVLDWENAENSFNIEKLKNYYAYILRDYHDYDYAYTLYFDDEDGEPFPLDFFTSIDFLIEGWDE